MSPGSQQVPSARRVKAAPRPTGRLGGSNAAPRPLAPARARPPRCGGSAARPGRPGCRSAGPAAAQATLPPPALRPPHARGPASLGQGYLLHGSLRGGVRGLGLLEQLQDLLEPLLVGLPLVLHLGCLENSRQQAAAVGGAAGPGRGRAERKEGRAREGARRCPLRCGSRAPTHPSRRRIDVGHTPTCCCCLRAEQRLSHHQFVIRPQEPPRVLLGPSAGHGSARPGRLGAAGAAVRFSPVRPTLPGACGRQNASTSILADGKRGARAAHPRTDRNLQQTRQARGEGEPRPGPAPWDRARQRVRTLPPSHEEMRARYQTPVSGTWYLLHFYVIWLSAEQLSEVPNSTCKE